jgi:TRAP-type C4-dicarboxylate transport system permease small subunit
MARLNAFWLGVDRLTLAIANLALVVMLVAICWNVISRYVLRSAVSWLEDITSIAFAWFIFIGMVAVHNRRGHISIDVLTSAAPARIQAAIGRAVDIFVACFCLYTAYLCAMQTVVSHGTAHTTVLKIPLSFLFASLALGFFLMALRSLSYAFGFAQMTEAE